MKIAVVTDSSAYINEKDVNNSNIFVLPLKIISGQETFDDTKDEFINRDLQKKIDNNDPVSTSMISGGELEVIYDDILKKYDKIIHFPIPVNLSSMYNVAMQTSQDDKYKDKVTVYGHYIPAGQLGEFIKYISNITKSSDMSDEEINAAIDLWSNECTTFVIPSDIAKLSKSGRTKTLLLALLRILRTKVCIEWKENPAKFAFSPKITKIAEKICEFISTKHEKDDVKILLHKPFYIEESYIEFSKMKKVFEENGYEVEVITTPTIYIIHAGTKTIGISIIKKSLIK